MDLHFKESKNKKIVKIEFFMLFLFPLAFLLSYQAGVAIEVPLDNARLPFTGSISWNINGNGISTANDAQNVPQLVSDGEGGAIIVWKDDRGVPIGTDIYAQRIRSSGSVQWTTDGVLISNASLGQYAAQITADGSGGAIIVWEDGRSGINNDIYTQRVNSSGITQWMANGTLICNAINNQDQAQIINDSMGGAIITWRDSRGSDADIYAQKINSTGAIQWTLNGTAICTSTNSQNAPQIVSDGLGGAIIVWFDLRNGNSDIYAQKINSTGTIQWTANGTLICNAVDSQNVVALVSDEAGGAIIAWQDNRNLGISGIDIYTQKVNSTGAAQWTVNGTLICNTAPNEVEPELIYDGAGGAIITWYENTNYDVYVQRINAVGVPQWTTNGTAICTATGQQYSPHIVSDGAGGAFISWDDERSGSVNKDIYTQLIDSAGTVKWTTNGIVVSAASNAQSGNQVISDGTGGAIVTWSDERNGASEDDIYAQRIVYEPTDEGGPSDDPLDNPPDAIPGYEYIFMSIVSMVSIIILIQKFKKKNPN